MASTKISGMPAAGALTGTELVPVVQSGVNKKTTTQAIADLSGPIPTQAGVPTDPPTGLPFNFDSTAVTGGLYGWTGAAWVKMSVIP